MANQKEVQIKGRNSQGQKAGEARNKAESTEQGSQDQKGGGPKTGLSKQAGQDKARKGR